MAQMQRARYFCALLFSIGASIGNAESYRNANDGTAVADDDIKWGFDISVEREHQEFSEVSGNITTVDFAPRLQYGSWDFSLDAPWQSADGQFVNNQFPPRIVATCEKAQQLAQKYPKIKRFATAVQKCQSAGVTDSQSDGSVSGMSDITAFARYGIPLDDDGIWLLSLGGGYKFDNGNVDDNLGSGTRNTLLEASLGASYGWFVGSITGGYGVVSGGDADTDSHYSYGGVDLGISPRPWVTLGCAVDYDESYVATSGNVTKTTVYVRLRPWQHLRVKFYARDYGNADGYPDREYGGSIAFTY